MSHRDSTPEPLGRQRLGPAARAAPGGEHADWTAVGGELAPEEGTALVFLFVAAVWLLGLAGLLFRLVTGDV